MRNLVETSPPQPSVEELTQKPSRLLWWLHPKVALPVTLIGLLLVAPFVYRGYRIGSVPDIGDPFDADAFGSVVIASDDNAMTHYREAQTLFRKRTSFSPEDDEKAFEFGWTQTSEPIRKWLEDNQPALAQWRKGTERSQAVVIQPKDMRFESTLEVIQETREFARLARLQAERSAHDGDVDAAWGWLLAVVRASRHVEQNGCLIQRLVGIAIHHSAADGINRWAANPKVTPDLLRKALVELHEADQLTPPISVAMKTEYLVLRNTLREAKSLTDLTEIGTLGSSTGPSSIQSSALYVMGEPELSLKVFQHVFANQLSEIDKPMRDRAPTTVGVFHLYNLPPGTSRCLPAFDLDEVVHSAPLARLTLPAYQQSDVATQRESVRRAVVPVMLGCQLHRRLHGDWPAKVEDLVPDILTELPQDPLGKSGELLRLKRDGEELLIYSVGANGIDDGGNISGSGGTNTEETPDQGIRAK